MKAGACADLSGVLLDADGVPISAELTHRIIGINAAQLRTIPEVIGRPTRRRRPRQPVRRSSAAMSPASSPTQLRSEPPRGRNMSGQDAASAGDSQREEQLLGGTANRGLVVRVGDTVHRPQTEGSAAVHDLLLHLEEVGFDGAPRYLGTDDQGREVLSYIDGEAPTVPYPAWAMEDDALVSVARLLRRYHAAVRTFGGSDQPWASSVPAAYRQGLVNHNDPNLDNIIFRDSEAVALIDFDLASPGSALWDVAVAARLWVPLRDPVDVPDDRARRTGDRLRLFADAYELDRWTDHDWRMPPRRRTAGATTSCVPARTWAAQGFVHWVATGLAEHDERGRQWLARHQQALREGVEMTGVRSGDGAQPQLFTP